MNIPIYAPGCDDFSTNGLGMLDPLECVIEEAAAGMYELTLVQPIDDSLRWAMLAPGCILKAPAPVRETPLYEAPAADGPVTITRQVWVVSGTTHGLYIRTGPGMNYRRIGVKQNGVEVLELEDAPDPWKKVCVLDSGQVGYMSTRYLAPLRTETEVVSPGAPTGGILKIGQSRDQLFRIYCVEQDSAAATVTARALHVFYDEAGNITGECDFPRPTDVNSALAAITSSLAADAQTSIRALNLKGEVHGDFSRKSPVEILLDPDAGIIRQTRALLVRDNWNAYLLPDTIRDRGVTIRRGKNLRGVEVTSDASGIVTRIIPVGKNKNGDPLYLPDPGWVDSPRAGEHPFPRIRRIEYDVQAGENGFADDEAVRSELRRLAEAQFSENGADLPSYGMDVDFVLLGNTAEYAAYASLQAVHLYDTVTVIDELLGLRARVRVTGYRWNCLTAQYEGVTLGEIQDLQHSIYSYNLPDGGISGTKIMANTLGGSALRNATIEYAKIAVAAVKQLSADSLAALTARIQELVAGSVTTDELYAGIADITKATIEKADIGWADIDQLNALIASIVQAKIETADIDFARIKDLVSDTAIITEGVGGQLFISRLAVTEANMVSLTTGELVVKGEDGHFYSLGVDESGKVITTLKQLGNDDVQDLSIHAGEKLIEGSVTAACLNAREIFADSAVIRNLIAANLDVDTLFAREAFINLLRTGKIVGNKSIEMIAGETDELNRLAGVETIEGCFAQSNRRGGGAIHIHSRFGPKQQGSGDPAPDNIRPISGRTGLQAGHAALNLAPPHTSASFPKNAGLTCSSSGGILSISGTATKNVRLDSPKIILPPGSYALMPNASVLIDATCYMRANDGTNYGSVSMKNSLAAKGTFTLTQPTQLCVSLYFTSGLEVNASFSVMLKRGTDAAPFEPYRGSIYALDFGQTVYGGRVDWAAGKLIIDRVLSTLDGTEEWKASATNTAGRSRFYAPNLVPGILPPPNTSTVAEGLMCSHYKSAPSTTGGTYQCVQSAGVYTSGALYFYDDRCAAGTAEEWKAHVAAQYAAGTPIQVAYRLAQPYTIPLTPVQIASLEGINSVYTDADGGCVEFGHDLPGITDSAMEPLSPKPGALWLDRSVTPAVLRRYSGSEWEIVNDVTLIETVQDALLTKQAELEAAQRETALFLKLDSANKLVRIGQAGVTSEFRIDAFGSGVAVNAQIFSRFEANRVLFGNMEIRKPAVGGLAFDSVAT